MPNQLDSSHPFARLVLLVAVLLFAAVLAPIAGTPATAQSALAGQGSVWVDLDGDVVFSEGVRVTNDFGASAFPLAGVEQRFEGAIVHLVDSAEVTVETTQTGPDGSYTFSQPPDGIYDVVFEAPDGYDFASLTPQGDSLVDSDPVPLPGEPQLARAVLEVSGTLGELPDAGLRPVANLALNWVDSDNDTAGVQYLATGSTPFDPYGDCPQSPPSAGSDCGQDDLYVRTNDVSTMSFSVLADNLSQQVPLLDEVIVEQHLEPADGAIVAYDVDPLVGLPIGCGTEGLTRPSSITTLEDGSSVLVCNMGAFELAEVKFVSVVIRTSGTSDPGSSFTTSSRAFALDNRAVPSGGLTSDPVTISAAPQFDLTIDRDSSNPLNRVREQAALVSRQNPVTGDHELGKVFYYDVSVLANNEGRGSTSLGSTISFTSLLDPQLVPFGASLVSCEAGAFAEDGAPRLPFDGHGAPYLPNQVADNGTWSCVAGVDGAVEVSVVGADTSAAHIPSTGGDGGDVSPYGVVLTGNVKVWYPISGFYRSVNPSWQAGDGVIGGSYVMTHCVADFDPLASDGATSNFGSSFEPGYGTADGAVAPSGNNCRTHNFTIYEPVGDFALRFGGKDRLHEGTNADNWPCLSAPRALLGAQTSCDSGDGSVLENQNLFVEVASRNQSGVGSIPDNWLCVAIDNSLYRIDSITDGSAQGLFAFAQHRQFGIGYRLADPADWATEYARFAPSQPQRTWNVDHRTADADATTGVIPADISSMVDGVGDCGESLGAAGQVEWTEDVSASGWSSDDVVMVRTRPRRADVVVGAGEDLILYVNLAARGEVWGSATQPQVGTRIAVGTAVATVGNYRQRGVWGEAEYDPNTHSSGAAGANVSFGDRAIYEHIVLSVDKRANKPDSAVGSDDQLAVPAGEHILWSLHPAATSLSSAASADEIEVIDVLPAYTSFDPTCTAPLPPGVGGPTIVDGPGAGETTMTWTLGHVETNVELPVIEVCTLTDPFAPPRHLISNTAMIDSANNSAPLASKSDTRSVRLIQVGGLVVRKSVDQSTDFKNDDQLWNLKWGNLSEQVPFAPTDVIDVFPWDGDTLGSLSERENVVSSFDGGLYLAELPSAPQRTSSRTGVVSEELGSWYFSADESATIDHNPFAASNDLTNGSTSWCLPSDFGVSPCPSQLDEIRAARFISASQLGPLDVVSADLRLTTLGIDPEVHNTGGDVYANRFVVGSETFPDLPIRSNEPTVQIVAFAVGDLLYADLNSDGTFTEGIDFVAPEGVAIELRKTDGSLVAETSTNAFGRWSVEGIDGGEYVVRIPAAEFSGPLEGWSVPAASDTVGVDPLDPDAAVSRPFTLTADQLESGRVVGAAPLADQEELSPLTQLRDDFTDFTIDIGLDPAEVLRLEVKACRVTSNSCDIATGGHWVDAAEIPAGTNATFRVTVYNTTPVVIGDISLANTDGLCDLASFALQPATSRTTTCEVRGLEANSTFVLAATATAEAVSTALQGSASVTTDGGVPGLRIEGAVNAKNRLSPGVAADADHEYRYVHRKTKLRFTYLVSNTGHKVLRNVRVVDDRGTTDTADDVRPVGIASGSRINVGDVNNNRLLDPGETWQYRRSDRHRAGSGGRTTIARVRANVADSTAAIVKAEDPTMVYGMKPGKVTIENAILAADPTNPSAFEDADRGPGRGVPADQPLRWTYQVSITGNVAATSITVLDNNGTTSDKSDDWYAEPLRGADGNVVGDVDADGLLDPGEVWIFDTPLERQVVRADGAQSVWAHAEATFPRRARTNGNLAKPWVRKGRDRSYHVVAQPQIDIESFIADVDADEPDGPTLTAGTTEKVTYVVTNTGLGSLRGAVVIDDRGTPETVDDFIHNMSSNRILHAGQSWTFHVRRTIGEGQQSESTSVTAKVTHGGRAVQMVEGEPWLAIDTDALHYRGAAGSPELFVKGCIHGSPDQCDPNNDAVWTGPRSIARGQTATWMTTVTNSSSTPMYRVGVKSSLGSVCTRWIGTLAPGETVRFRCRIAEAKNDLNNSSTVTGRLCPTTGRCPDFSERRSSKVTVTSPSKKVKS